MTQNPSSTSSSEVPHGLIRRRRFALLGLLAGIAVLEIVGSRLPNPMREELAAHREKMATTGGNYYQIMGDSACVHAIDENVIANRTGKSCINLGRHATGPVFTYFFLKTQIESGQELPHTIIYAPSPHTFASSRIARFFGAYGTPAECLEVALESGEYSESVYGVLCRFSYWLRYRDQWSEVLRGDRSGLAPLGLGGAGVRALPGEEQSRTDDDSHATTVSTTPSAGQSATSGGRVFTEKNLPRSTYGKAFSALTVNDVYVKKFLALAREHNIEVIWALPPVLEVVARTREPFNFTAAYLDYRTGLADTYGVKLLHRQFQILPDVEFIDYTHTTPHGQALYSESLAADLRALQPEAAGPAPAPGAP